MSKLRELPNQNASAKLSNKPIKKNQGERNYLRSLLFLTGALLRIGADRIRGGGIYDLLGLLRG